MHLRHIKYQPNGGSTGATEVAEVMSICVETITTGRCFISSISATYVPDTVETEVATNVTVPMERTSI